MTFKLTSVHPSGKFTHSKAIGCTVTCGIVLLLWVFSAQKCNPNSQHPSKVCTFIWIMKTIMYKAANASLSTLCKCESRAFDTISYSQTWNTTLWLLLRSVTPTTPLRWLKWLDFCVCAWFGCVLVPHSRPVPSSWASRRSREPSLPSLFTWF